MSASASWSPSVKCQALRSRSVAAWDRLVTCQWRRGGLGGDERLPGQDARDRAARTAPDLQAAAAACGGQIQGQLEAGAYLGALGAEQVDQSGTAGGEFQDEHAHEIGRAMQGEGCLFGMRRGEGALVQVVGIADADDPIAHRGPFAPGRFRQRVEARAMASPMSAVYSSRPCPIAPLVTG